MSMNIGVAGPPLDAVTYALLTNGYLNIKSAGVRINGYFVPSVPDTPMFGFDVENSLISGFDVGSWPTVTEGT
jgi:hypothetical protein